MQEERVGSKSFMLGCTAFHRWIRMHTMMQEEDVHPAVNQSIAVDRLEHSGSSMTSVEAMNQVGEMGQQAADILGVAADVAVVNAAVVAQEVSARAKVCIYWFCCRKYAWNTIQSSDEKCSLMIWKCFMIDFHDAMLSQEQETSVTSTFWDRCWFVPSAHASCLYQF